MLSVIWTIIIELLHVYLVRLFGSCQRAMNFQTTLNLTQSSSSSVKIATASDSTCYSQSGKVACFGWNIEDVLGRGDTVLQIGDEPGELPTLMTVDLGHDFVLKLLQCGDYHCCVVSVAGLAKCWGSNGYGI